MAGGWQPPPPPTLPRQDPPFAPPASCSTRTSWPSVCRHPPPEGPRQQRPARQPRPPHIRPTKRPQPGPPAPSAQRQHRPATGAIAPPPAAAAAQQPRAHRLPGRRARALFLQLDHRLGALVAAQVVGQLLVSCQLLPRKPQAAGAGVQVLAPKLQAGRAGGGGAAGWAGRQRPGRGGRCNSAGGQPPGSCPARVRARVATTPVSPRHAPWCPSGPPSPPGTGG